jgi:hypothetical protein
VLARRVATTRSRARAFAERTGLDWADPTQWIDHGGKSHDLEGPRLRVVLEAIEIRRDYDPWIKGAGEISFTARVETPANGGTVAQVRVPDSGVFRLSDGQRLELEQTIFSGHASEELRVEIVGREEDLLDPDDWMGKYARIFDCKPEEWFGSYGPEGGAVSPEDVGPWRVWYRIDRGGL